MIWPQIYRKIPYPPTYDDTPETKGPRKILADFPPISSKITLISPQVLPLASESVL